jgi:hypothetical protein
MESEEKEKKTKPQIKDVPENIKNFFGMPDLNTEECFIKVYSCEYKSGRNRGPVVKAFEDTYYNTFVGDEFIKEEYGPGHYELMLHINHKTVQTKTVRIAGDKEDDFSSPGAGSDLQNLVGVVVQLMPAITGLISAIKGKKDPLDKLDTLVSKVAENQIKNLDKYETKMFQIMEKARAVKADPEPIQEPEMDLGKEIVLKVISTFKEFLPLLKSTKGLEKIGLMQEAKEAIDEDPDVKKVLKDPELFLQVYDGLVSAPGIKKTEVDDVLKRLGIEIKIDKVEESQPA